ncbi:MAG: peptide ABC transporter substrate-binding protein [Spirochaetales bacterium]|nr:peptide ABC transporter substrate-binding protein [Spirochaetales bacterium]
MKKILMVLLVLTMAFTAFAGGGQEDTASDSATPAASMEPVVFKYNNQAEPESLDPHVTEGVPEANIARCLFENLVSYDPQTLGPVPGVAESWEVSDDGLTWTFKIRKDAKWSDGVAITAQTVVDSWIRMVSPELAASYAYLPGMVIKGANAYNSGDAGPEAVAIRALDDYTFQFDLVGPAPYVLGMLSHGSFSIVPMHTIEKFGTEWVRPENIVTNGPFMLKNYIPQDKIVFEKSATYWDADAVKLDEVIFYPIDDANTAINMFLQGDLDWLPEVPDARLDEMKLRDDYNINEAFITYYYEFNQTEPPFDDVRVRKAFAMSIDRQELIDRVARGGQSPAFGLTPPLAKYPAVVGFEESVAEAKRLLAEAGYPNGAGFPDTTLIYNTSEGHKRIAEYCQQKWAENLGIEITIENQEWATFVANRQEQNFEIARAGWQGDYVDPNTFLEDLLHSASGNNDGKYNSAMYDGYLEEAKMMPEGQARYDVLAKAEALAIGEDMALMPFYYYTTMNWIDTDVWGGWYTTVLDVHPIKAIYKK